MTLRAGDLFQIRARYDNGGYPCLLVTRVCGRHIWTIPAGLDGTPAWNHRELKFCDRAGLTARQRVAKYWKRLAQPQRETQGG